MSQTTRKIASECAKYIYKFFWKGQPFPDSSHWGGSTHNQTLPHRGLRAPSWFETCSHLV